MSLLTRVDRTIGYVRSFADDPTVPGKGSMARLCAILALLAGGWTTYETVRFAFAALAKDKSDAAMLGILAGLATTLFGTVCVGLLKRTTSAGVTETIDDVRLTQERAAANVDVSVKTGAGQ